MSFEVVTATPVTSWRYVSIIHNLPLEEPIGNEFIAIVPPTDQRLVREHGLPGFRTFIGRFRDQFGRKVTPSILILRDDVKADIELVVGFRNALAISAVIQAWIKFLSHGAQLQHFKFSDYFALYPHALSKDGQDVVVNSPSQLGLDEVANFHGQTTPGISSPHPTKQFYDPYLFAALLDRWKRKFIRRSKAWEDTALFRSLQMAYRASAMPFQNNATFEDYGAQVSLWVSAHEILTHPEQGRACLSNVLTTLGNAQFSNPALRAKRYSALFGNKRVHMSLPQKLYWEIHRSRNHFLHGNPVTAKDVFPASRTDRYPLTCFCPILYRCALHEFLGLCKQDVYSVGMTTERVRRTMYEDALLAATKRAEKRRRAGVRRKT